MRVALPLALARRVGVTEALEQQRFRAYNRTTLLAGVVEVETPAVVVLSGGNIDPLVLRTLISTGLAEQDRYLAIRCRVQDRPGSLAKLLDEIADERANVVTVEHHRLRDWIGLGMVEVVLELETRGSDHAAKLVATLRDHGYDVEEA